MSDEERAKALVEKWLAEDPDGDPGYVDLEELERRFAAALAEERERAAQLAEAAAKRYEAEADRSGCRVAMGGQEAGEVIAAAIRARSEP